MHTTHHHRHQHHQEKDALLYYIIFVYTCKIIEHWKKHNSKAVVKKLHEGIYNAYYVHDVTTKILAKTKEKNFYFSLTHLLAPEKILMLFHMEFFCHRYKHTQVFPCYQKGLEHLTAVNNTGEKKEYSLKCHHVKNTLF